MSLSDIINALAGWGISVTPEQLKSPNPDFVETVYCACLQQVTGLSRDSLQEPVQNALANSQVEDKVSWARYLLFLHTKPRYQDLYASALTNNIILYHLYENYESNSAQSHTFHSVRFAKAARVEDFNSRDIYSPERERTLILLSAFINFVKFTEQYCDAFLKDLRDRSDALIVRREDTTVELSELQDKIDELK